MRRRLVRGRIGGRVIRFVEDETRRIVRRLEDIEAAISRFADRRLVVGARGGDKGSTFSGLTRT